MFKKSIFAILPLIFLGLLYAVYIYFFKIDFSSYHYIQLTSAAFSPNGKYMVGVTAYKTEVNAEAVYIGVSLYELDKEGNYTNEKILVSDKVPAKEVETKKTFEERLEFSLQVKWISNENINLNGKIINLVDRYDYRRDLRNWMKYIMDYFSLVFIYNESRFE